MRAHMRTCAPTHAHMHAHMRGHMPTCTPTCTPTCPHARPHAHMHACAHVPPRAHRGRDFDTRPLSVSNAPLTSPVKRGRPPPRSNFHKVYLQKVEKISSKPFNFFS